MIFTQYYYIIISILLLKMSEGAYMYYSSDYDNYHLMLYKKLSQNKLKKALGSLYNWFSGDYFIAIFIKGSDYIGQTNYKYISNFIKSDKVVNILDTTYIEAKKVLKNLTEDEFERNVKFSIKQLNNSDNDNNNYSDNSDILKQVYNYLFG